MCSHDKRRVKRCYRFRGQPRTKIMSLPILLFDERRLSPAWGYVFDRGWLKPAESILSILWRFARENATPGHVIVGEAARERIDPYQGVNFDQSEIHVEHLARSLRVARTTLRAALGPASRTFGMSSHLRWCTTCLNLGYHSVVHQLEVVRTCPIHASQLRDVCKACNQTSPYRLHARLMDGPYRCSACGVRHGHPLLQKKLPWRIFNPITRKRAVLLGY